ncbi:unnamed protein product [Arabidopsis halleri]
MNSIDYPPLSLVICPTIRLSSAKMCKFKMTEISGLSFLIIDNSYHISDYDDAEDKTHQLRLFLGCNNEEGGHYCYACNNDHKFGFGLLKREMNTQKLSQRQVKEIKFKMFF